MAQQCDIGMIGLGVMGSNLARNLESHGFRVAGYDLEPKAVERFVAGGAGEHDAVGANSLAELASQLAKPRKVMMMVKAGSPVDQVIDQLIPHLEPGDVIIDGGNSHFADTVRRTKALEEKSLLFIGSGVSGGEEGALKGPSIMPGGSHEAWPLVKPMFQAIAAKVGPNKDIPCCEWIGNDGAGHYVKMVHNGIEYGDMQLICESYFLLKHALGLTNAELYEVFDEWNRGELNSYLIEITRDIFSVKDPESDRDLVDSILDVAGAKGTGKWMSQLALDLGVPTTLITEAVYARGLSALKEARVRASKVLQGPAGKFEGDRKAFIEDVRHALYASKICSYAQGFVQLQAAAKEYGWKLNFSQIALLWRGGCIIRAQFLERISEAFDTDPELENLLLAPYFTEAVHKAQVSWRRVAGAAIELGLPAPACLAALTYYDGYRNERLPANLLQAQRDYFGAHTYQRVDREGSFHTDWIRQRREPQD